MLIFQLHLPHVVTNSMQALHAPSHSYSVSISTCKFEALSVKTALPKADLSDNWW